MSETDSTQPEAHESTGRTRKWPSIGVALAVLWLFVRGVHFIDEPWLAVGEFILGLVVGLPIAFVFRRFYARTYGLSRTVQILPAAVAYVGLFVWELITANYDVAKRVLSPSMPIHPDVIEVPLRVETDVAVTTIANSITLTPGTLTMDYDEDRNALYVHAIAARDEESIVEPIRRWEDYALVIFDERRSPGSPVPDPETPAGESPVASKQRSGGEQ
ncbi:Na+/H+ antiporter subunit E [Haloarchaeobius amylolyticus]|uniref:Na+/H+ antiporter subunit E n=1 Tax=Haloarchaeobius amylolyticus TaxID=1198296 RepID=UPI0022712024|nr:Na+/H+ antiporter subunit E [Haloarchaeobius amylolyticus]